MLGWATFALTVALLIVTGVYAWLTWRMVKVTEQSTVAALQQADALTRPYIVIRPFQSGGTFYLKVENTGASVAEDLKLTTSVDFNQGGSERMKLSEAGLFTTGAPSFPPRAEVNYLLGGGSDLFSQKADDTVMPRRFDITASYRYGGKTVEEKMAVDLQQYNKTIQYVSREHREDERRRKAIEQGVKTLGNILDEMRRVTQRVEPAPPPGRLESPSLISRLLRKFVR